MVIAGDNLTSRTVYLKIFPVSGQLSGYKFSKSLLVLHTARMVILASVAM